MSLNVFSKHYCSYHNVGLKKKLREPFLRLKWAYQRITRGYSDFDCYDLAHFYGEMICETLAHLSNNTHGYPQSEEYPTFESWQEALCAAADDFDLIKNYEFNGSKTLEYQKEYMRTNTPYNFVYWMQCAEEDDEVRNAAMDRAFGFLKTNWFDLWD